jgi:alpha-mannosidase
LVKSGQLNFVHGGYVSPDEASPNYNDLILNLQMGRSFLDSTFGVLPTTGWQLDPFGHSSVNARLFAEVGLDSMIFSRINYQTKTDRKAADQAEFIWKPHGD